MRINGLLAELVTLTVTTVSPEMSELKLVISALNMFCASV